MPRVDFVASSDISSSSRVRQLEAMFDVPRAKRSRVEWHAKIPFEEKPWNVGLIVGPSGAGKSTVARQLFGDHVDTALEWKGKSVIDDFDQARSMDEIAAICQAVGFNTIPAWLRPFRVLSTGEQFRVGLARRLLEGEDPIVIDEFTSVVDRQVAKIGAHAVQKYIRRNKRQFVGVSCHYDILDWLQPDWTFEPATSTFNWRSVQPRPQLNVEISRVHPSSWQLFAPYHYMSAKLHKAARCFVLFVDGQPASFAGILHRPHFKATNIKGISRQVTLPDWQGLGLAFVLMDALGAAYKAIGCRLHHYPAHPGFIRSLDRSPRWKMTRRPASFIPTGKTTTLGMSDKERQRIRWEGHAAGARTKKHGTQGMRPCATFCYVGEAMAVGTAKQLTGI